MWNLVQKLNMRAIHKGNQIDLHSIRFKIRNIYSACREQPSKSNSQASIYRGPRGRNQSTSSSFEQQKKARSFNFDYDSDAKFIEQNTALVATNYTRFTFYTKSCQIYCLIELSKEMFDFDSDGFLQAEKCQQFVRNWMERCKADGSTHEIVFILYARLYYPQVKNME